MAGSSDRAPRVQLVRHGCRVNQADAEAVLHACGARPPRDGADVVLVSTCVVTADAESTAFQAVRRASRDHPGVPVVVVGCAGGLKRDELARLEGVVAVVGPGEVERAADAVRAAALAASGNVAPCPSRSTLPSPSSGVRARPTIKIQDGCDQRCAYCVVPLARGRSRSLPLATALERVAEAGRQGDEVILAGIHLGAYGRDLVAAGGRKPTLGVLVGEIARRGLVHRVRLSSIDPLEIPVEALAGSAAAVLCGHFHLPLQSGSTAVLRAMRRPYSAGEAAAAVEGISRALPGACIGADVMSGFPGETEADHRATVALVRALPLAVLHVFTFSPRAGTVAASMPGQVPASVARDRAAELRALSDASWRGYVDGLVGREVEAVVERVAGGEARGTTREGVLARWSLAADVAAPPRGRATGLRAVTREGDGLWCERA